VQKCNGASERKGVFGSRGMHQIRKGVVAHGKVMRDEIFPVIEKIRNRILEALSNRAISYASASEFTCFLFFKRFVVVFQLY